MNKIRISSDALADLNEGFLFYEQQTPGLGDYFFQVFEQTLKNLNFQEVHIESFISNSTGVYHGFSHSGYFIPSAKR